MNVDQSLAQYKFKKAIPDVRMLLLIFITCYFKGILHSCSWLRKHYLEVEKRLCTLCFVLRFTMKDALTFHEFISQDKLGRFRCSLKKI